MTDQDDDEWLLTRTGGALRYWSDDFLDDVLMYPDERARLIGQHNNLASEINASHRTMDHAPLLAELEQIKKRIAELRGQKIDAYDIIRADLDGLSNLWKRMTEEHYREHERRSQEKQARAEQERLDAEDKERQEILLVCKSRGHHIAIDDQGLEYCTTCQTPACLEMLEELKQTHSGLKSDEQANAIVDSIIGDPNSSPDQRLGRKGQLQLIKAAIADTSELLPRANAIKNAGEGTFQSWVLLVTMSALAAGGVGTALRAIIAETLEMPDDVAQPLILAAVLLTLIGIPTWYIRKVMRTKRQRQELEKERLAILTKLKADMGL